MREYVICCAVIAAFIFAIIDHISSTDDHKESVMKTALLSLAFVAALSSASVAAQAATGLSLESLQSLTADQRDALVAVLSSLPRQ